MLDNHLNLTSICAAFSQYAQAPERNGATRALKEKFNQTTVTKVLIIVKEFINKQDIQSKEQSKDLTNLYKDIQLLVTKEREHHNKGCSILHKNYRIADFFRSLFNWKYSRKKEIYEAQLSLNQLEISLYEKCISARKKEKDPLISQRLRKFNINEENLSKSKAQFILLIDKIHKGWPILSNKKKWLDADLIKLFSRPDFQSLFNCHIEKFQAKTYDKSHLTLLRDIYIQAREKFIESTGKNLGGDEAIQIMIFIVLKLPISLSLLKLETEITEEDRLDNLQRTLVEFEAAVMYVVNPYAKTPHKIDEKFSLSPFLRTFVTTIKNPFGDRGKMSK